MMTDLEESQDASLCNANYKLAQTFLKKPLSLYYTRYFNKYKFFPMNNNIVREIQEQYSNIKEWDESNAAVYDHIKKEIENLQSQLSKQLKIEIGDWVTTSKSYAKEHGKSHLNNNYRIIYKTVKAKDLFSEGNSIHEWGYDP